MGSNLDDDLYRTVRFLLRRWKVRNHRLKKGDCYVTVKIRTAGNDNNAMRKQSNARGSSNQPSSTGGAI